MQPKRIGPIPLLQGLQLDPPVGKPGGLLDVRNMEDRNGHLATRRGVSIVGDAEPDAEFGNVVSMTAFVKSPAVWGGQSVTYLGATGLTIRPGEWLILRLGVTVANTTEFDFLKLDYSTGNSWRPLRYVWNAREHGFEIVFLEGAGDNETYIKFMCPEDWHDQDVGGTTAFWLRFQPMSYSGAALTFSANAEVNLASCALFFTELSQRDAIWCPFREGERIVTYGDATNVVTRRSVFDWSVFGAGSGNPDGGNTPWQESLYTAADISGRPEVSMLYVPAIDRLLVAFASKANDCPPKVLYANDVSGRIDVDNDTAWPDEEAEDTAWQDVPVESALPDVQHLELFNERVFILGANSSKHEVRWSAPAEFCTIVPSSNYYRLPGGGGGALVGAAVVHRTLYLFTETAIWSVHEVDAIEGEDSRMIFNLVEQTGCTSKRSIAVVNGSVLFLSTDGVRVFDGQSSRPATRDVSALFETDSEHPMAVRRSQMQYAVGVHDPVEAKFYLFYPTPSSRCGNNAALVLDLDTGASYLWGEDRAGRLDDDEETFAEDGRTPWGFQANAACWDPTEGKVFVAQKQGLAGYIGGSMDYGQPIPWKLETHHVGLGDRRFQILRSVDLEIQRVHYDWGVNISIIPDGRLDLKDTRLLAAERDGASASDASFDYLSVDAGGTQLAEADNSYVPVKARYASRARNHRVAIEGEAIDYGNTPRPIKIASLSVDVLDTGRR